MFTYLGILNLVLTILRDQVGRVIGSVSLHRSDLGVRATLAVTQAICMLAILLDENLPLQLFYH